MPAVLSLDDARVIFGNDVLGPAEVAEAFAASPREIPAIPFSGELLEAAQRAGEMLLLRLSTAPDGRPLTLLHMIEGFADAFDPKLLRQMGYQLKDDWGIALEPLAARETCATGWALVRKHILDDSRNLPYDDQAAALQRYAQQQGVAAVRRRSAVEAVYDTLLYFRTRRVRLLDKTWDWSASATIDGGYLNVGGFGDNGMQILSYSRACRHGALGVCPTRGAETRSAEAA